MQTYKEALEQLKQSPWHEFLATQSDLDAIVEKIDQEAQSKTIFPSPVQKTLKSSFWDKTRITTQVKLTV